MWLISRKFIFHGLIKQCSACFHAQSWQFLKYWNGTRHGAAHLNSQVHRSLKQEDPWVQAFGAILDNIKTEGKEKTILYCYLLGLNKALAVMEIPSLWLFFPAFFLTDLQRILPVSLSFSIISECFSYLTGCCWSTTSCTLPVILRNKMSLLHATAMPAANLLLFPKPLRVE